MKKDCWAVNSRNSPKRKKYFRPSTHIIIENPAGEITINKSSDDQVHLLSFFRVYYSDKKRL